jgi:hypothetical protein
VLKGSRPVFERKLFWRYKANHQRAIRDGAYKYLKIGKNEYLFNVVEDPLERANLKDRDPGRFSRMKAEWLQWNKGMLPQLDERFTEGVLAERQADHAGAASVDKTADVRISDCQSVANTSPTAYRYVSSEQCALNGRSA